MKIHHIAIWTRDIECLAAFYCRWFGCTTNQGYHNPAKQFTSKFIYFDGGCSLELMHHSELIIENQKEKHTGFAHIAISVGTKEKVDALTVQMEKAGITVIGQPRTTGDGYYESIITDPDGNWVEITE
jgi:lactoylglutathione lyase